MSLNHCSSGKLRAECGSRPTGKPEHCETEINIDHADAGQIVVLTCGYVICSRRKRHMHAAVASNFSTRQS
jgi:hypothetical protein